MALLLDGDRPHIPIGADRVVPDLVAKLPGLFGEDAPLNIARASLLHNEKVRFFPRRTIYPLTYAAVHAETGGPFDNVDVEAHTSIFNGGWQVEVRGSVHGTPGFEAWWEGDHGDPNSHRVSFAWAGAMPAVMVDTRNHFVFAGSEVSGVVPMDMVDLVKLRKGKRNRWIERVYRDYPVEPIDMRVNPDRNTISALLTRKGGDTNPFLLWLPLVLDTNLRNGLPNRRMMG